MIEPTIHIVSAKDLKGVEAIESKLRELNFDVIVIVPENSTFDLEKEKPLITLKFNELKERDACKKIVQPVTPKQPNEIRKKRPRIYR